MRIIIGIVISVFIFSSAYSQNTFKALIKAKESSEALPGATANIKSLSLGATANEQGVLQIANVPDGEHIIEFSFVGYESQSIAVTFPRSSQEPMEISLQPSEEELEEIVVSSTRSSRTIADIPTRVEFIAGEELEEKGNMKPGDIRMLLNESTGIQTQQTSATSANASIRIQGLDGRYTQILKDGFPLYAGFSGGLGLLQTPPLDLKQVEVIKGSSSTLYGGGAIAGLVNLISKRPTEERELRLWANGTSAKGLDLNGFYGQQLGKVGVTLFLSRNTNAAYDPANIDLTAIPKFERYTINPKLFFELNAKNKLDVGLNFNTEDRIGGDMLYIDGKGDNTHSYFEENNSDRFSTQVSYTHLFNAQNKLNVKNSINHFKRLINTPGYTFDGVQNSTFTELNYVSNRENSEWIGGVNLWTDTFSENRTTATPLRDYDQTTMGAFVQNNAKLSEAFRLESGLRGDYVIDYGFSLLPRVSLLYKPSLAFSSRLGGGLGYKAPTIFTEESERIQYRNVRPVLSSTNKLERSYGANWDFNYKTSFSDGAVGLSINQLFFYTYLNDPLFLAPLQSGDYEFVNLTGYTDSKGTETNVKLDYADFKLFIGYTYTDTKIHNEGIVAQNPLTAKHRLNNVLMYEVEEKWKVGLEAYYFSPQKLSDGTTGKEYWICGLMIEKIWEHLSVYVNFENFTDTRQTRFDSIYTGTITNPVFRDIYAPVDGFVVNGGVKISL
ncbi:TonB-dependent receptor [Chryseolinea lacunae]|uniref:TonB-dependent receptor n=1 Tax=Chryseolinea lacunae TaxID=2801331 RepID=A0ABS1KYE6_9BACT|nr:TonB-dependent receptor [Chryseolinea lacunae]MBL0744475.1 TonB-dependent receptor [Chryseolinea lacunae]